MTPCCPQEHDLPVNTIPVTIHFHGWLKKLIGRSRRSSGPLSPPLARRTSIKDIIESFGVPHTEVGAIEINQQTVTFDHILTKRSMVEIFPHSPPVNVLAPSLLRPRPLSAIRFLVDANVGKLAGKLRMVGFDTLFNPLWHDAELAGISEEKECILLSRDIQLLKRKKVTFGHFVRETCPTKQLAEIIHLYGLSDKICAFSRCMRCNGILAPVSKQEVLSRLEPLTRKYYNSFQRCNSCSHVYWSGSHLKPMEKNIKALTDYCPLSE
ncbi:hypothetical protein HNV12_09975 [Methanococcoides sp. SA1]|nr:hypothetical protein [Methanococcoides sp. SA1]